MKKQIKRRISILLAAVMAVGSLAFSAAPVSAAQPEEPSKVASASYGLPDKIEDGAILHCWCWNFETIKANLPRIAEAGFKSIQTSPINAIKIGDNGKMSLKSTNKGNWWYQYQPTDYTIGNYMLGTEDEFKDMCNEAHKYGIKVIVDIVANHCSSDYSAISSHVKNIGGKAFHDRVEITDWSNRYQVTQGKLTGLWDLNTQNAKVQQMIVDYMTTVLADGADGFRFDAAKHIELPDDDASYAGNFWPTILDNDAEFQYGEMLTGADRAADYAKLMKITADAYGSNLRAALQKQKLTSTTAKNYRLAGVDAGQLITWVESHDNYCTDDNPSQNQYSSWYTLNNEQIQYQKSTKEEYINNLKRCFKNNSYINLVFDEIEVMRHPKRDDIFGVTLKQHWNSSNYSDVGYLFLMINFEDEMNPTIQVRTWQPDKYNGKPLPREEVFSLDMFSI